MSNKTFAEVIPGVRAVRSLGAVKENAFVATGNSRSQGTFKKYFKFCQELFAYPTRFSSGIPLNCFTGADHANIDRRTLTPIEFCPITLERRQNLKREVYCLCHFHRECTLNLSPFIDSLLLELALCATDVSI